jgi:hypothetical protein
MSTTLKRHTHFLFGHNKIWNTLTHLFSQADEHHTEASRPSDFQNLSVTTILHFANLPGNCITVGNGILRLGVHKSCTCQTCATLTSEIVLDGPPDMRAAKNSNIVKR